MKKLTLALLSLMLFLGMGTAFAQGDMPGFGGGTLELSQPTLNPASGFVKPGATIDATFSDETIQSITSASQGAMAFVLYVVNDEATQLETSVEVLSYLMSQLMGGDEDELAILEDDDDAPSYAYQVAAYGMDPEFDPEDADDMQAYMKWYKPITIQKDAAGDLKFRLRVAAMSQEGEVVYSDEFTADYTTKPSLPTFKPETGASVEPGDMITFSVPDELMGSIVFYAYVFDNDNVDLKPSFKEAYAAMDPDEESDLDYMVTASMYGQAMPAAVPDNIALGTTTKMRVRMAVAVGDDGDETPTLVYSDVAEATYTVVAPVPAPAPMIEMARGIVSINFEEDEEAGYAAYYVIDKDDFDFSKYKTDEEIEEAGAKLATNGGNIKVNGTCTIKAATCKARLDMQTYETKLSAWSDVVEATYKVPAAPTFEPASGATVDFGVKLTLTCDDEDAWILYTTDGTEPSEDNDNVFYYNSYRGAQITATTIKAVAVLNGVPSDVVTATYELNPITATLSLVPMQEDEVGMNVGTGIEFDIDDWMDYPAAVYYTTDGTTTPSKETYEAQADKENGAIKMLEPQKDADGYVSKTDNHILAVTFSEATHFKAIGYITLAGQDVVTPVLDKELKVKAEANPTFSVASGAEVEVGDNIVIKNPNPYPAEPDIEMPDFEDEEGWLAYDEAWKKYDALIAEIPATELYFSFDGTKPTTVAYDGQEVDWDLDRPYENYNVFKTKTGKDITVFFNKDEQGFYACVPAIDDNINMGHIYDTIRLDAEAKFAVQVFAVTTDQGENGGIDPYKAAKAPGDAAAFVFGSEFVTATYTVKEKEEPVVETVATPTFSVAAGEVAEGTKVSIACETEGAVIYYTVDNSEPTAESTEYKEAITIDKAMTVKAIAVKGEAKSEVATAAYTVKTANEDEELAGVSVFPNPSNGLFNIELPVAATIEVFASNGVLTQRISANAGVATLNIDRSGIYFLRITGEGRTAIKRVIVR